MRPCAARHIRAFLLFSLLAALSAAADRPLLPDPPQGTGSASFAGGGAGQAGGVNAIFVNPGALAIVSGSQVELGMMGLSEGISPYGLFGSRSGPWSYALGYFYDTRIGPFRNAMTAGAAREILPGLSAGASMRSQGGAEGFGVDGDAGLLLRPRGWALMGDWAVAGLAVRNLAESGVGQEPEGYETLRSYAASLGIRRDAARLLFLPIREPDLSYEFRSAEGFSPGGMSHTFSTGAGFTPSGALALRATLQLPHTGSATIALGGFLNLALGAGVLRCGYAFSSAGLATGIGAPTHSLSMNLATGLRTDRQPPWVSVRADRVLLDSSGPGRDRVHFRLKAADRSAAAGGSARGDDFAPAGPPEDQAMAPGGSEAGGRGELREWSLGIFSLETDGRKGRPVRTFQGKDLPPRLIRWDGRDEAGGILKPGFYAYRLWAKDKAGNVGETAWQLVEVGALAGAAGAVEGADPDQPAGTPENGNMGRTPAEQEAPLPPILEGDDG